MILLRSANNSLCSMSRLATTLSFLCATISCLVGMSLHVMVEWTTSGEDVGFHMSYHVAFTCVQNSTVFF